MAATTLTVVALMGPLTASAVSYIYACVPATGGSGEGTNSLYMYNTVATTANVTAKVLTRTNVHLSTLINPATFTVAGGTTKVVYWNNPSTVGGSWSWDDTNAATFPTTIRITSDQPLVVGSNNYAGGNNVNPCLPTTF
jgi:hypothetical protein